MHNSYFTHVINDPNPIHEVWRGMQMLHALGMPMPPVAEIRQQLFFARKDEVKANTILNSGLPRPWIGLAVGASGDFKRWPAAHMAALATRILKDLGGTIFILGYGSDDTKTAETILAKNPQGTVNCVGQCSARETALVIKAGDVLVANDSFALHAAATVGTPVAEIIGHPADGNPSSENLPMRFGPWGVPFAWAGPLTCQGSHHIQYDFRREEKCIADVPVDVVFDLLTEVIRRWPKR